MLHLTHFSLLSAIELMASHPHCQAPVHTHTHTHAEGTRGGLVTKSCPTLANPWTVAHQVPLSMDFPGKNPGEGSHFLLQWIFPTQGSNPGLLHLRQMIYRLSYVGSPEGTHTPCQAPCTHMQMHEPTCMHAHTCRRHTCSLLTSCLMLKTGWETRYQ